MPIISKHGGNIHQVIREYKPERVIDFSASINPLGLPAGVRQALSCHWETLLHYPDPGCTELKMALAHKLDISLEQILVSNGSIELIYLIPQVLRPKRSLVLAPSFSELEQACVLSGSQVDRIGLQETDGFSINAERIMAWLGGVQLVIIANPNNPTGRLFPPDELFRLLRACEEQGIWLVVDEAFLDFAKGADEYSLIDKTATSERLIILRSMTKFYALAGLRLGYGVGNRKLMAKLEEHKPPWSVNQLAQVCGLAALMDGDYPERSRQLITQQREFLWHELSQNGRFKPYPSAVNYLLVRLSDSSLTSSQLQERLIAKGYLIRDCANFVGLDNSFFRLAVRSPAENSGLIRALREYLN